MVQIPGWVYVLLTAVALGVLAVAAGPVSARAKALLSWVAGGLAVVLFVLALLLAASP